VRLIYNSVVANVLGFVHTPCMFVHIMYVTLH